VIARLIFDCLEQREDLAFAEDPLGEFLLECWPADRGAGPRRIRFYRCGHVSKPPNRKVPPAIFWILTPVAPLPASTLPKVTSGYVSGAANTRSARRRHIA
jgi:hypothetical protein